MHLLAAVRSQIRDGSYPAGTWPRKVGEHFRKETRRES
jgi:hypothetical protein